MAARYVHELRAVQPEGPYLLGGHSAGGVIAYEMAQQLLAEGKKAQLLLLDTGSLASVRGASIESADDVLRQLIGLKDAAPKAYQGFVAALREDAPFRAIVLSTWRAMTRYEPRPTEASVLFVRARDQLGASEPDDVDYWRDLTRGRFVMHQVPGNHFTMMEPPQVASVARVVRAHITARSRVRARIPESTARSGLSRWSSRRSGPDSSPDSGQART
jgi:thioesterase domain-containing protein